MWRQHLRNLASGVALVIGVIYLVTSSASSPEKLQANARRAQPVPVTSPIDNFFKQTWSREKTTPTKLADDLTILRRLSLSLHGTIPSLEEIRTFEADTAPDRLTRWTQRMLDDPRFSVYFAERLAKVYAGADDKPFLVFREDRFQNWIAEQLHNDRPYDQWVNELISQTGLWTGKPSVNFITAAANDSGIVDVNELTSRTTRAFLGQRIDCAQCHDHPFAAWKQTDYQGLAAFYGDCHLSVFGVYDGEPTKREQRMMEMSTEDGEKHSTTPAVPFDPERLASNGPDRTRLADWITHPTNKRFHRATVNRIWGLLFGISYSELEPLKVAVDDLPDPPASPDDDLLEQLAEDFRQNDCRLKSLILAITTSKAYRLSSETDLEDDEQIDRQGDWWARFPLSRLRPEQVIGAMAQSGSLSTIDQNSHLVARLIRLIRERDFVREYGPITDEELAPHGATIPQALLRMNGKMTSELLEANPFNASARLTQLSPDNETLIETAFLMTLTRRPTPREQTWFNESLTHNPELKKEQLCQDLLWTLINSEEFNWNH
jgi:hypothetical protein